MKRIHLLPNVLTAFGLTCGLFVIFKLNMTDVGRADEQVLMTSALILLVAGIFDLLDGFVARAMNATSEFGGLFDSLADAVTFGVAPSVIVLKGLSVEPKTFASFALTTSALVFSVSGVMRLVRYSVSAHEGDQDEKLKNFTGLPIPAAASCIVSLILLLSSTGMSQGSKLAIMCCAMISLGYLMISRLRFPSVKKMNWRVGSFHVVFAVVFVAAVLLYGMIYHFPLVFAFSAWAYVVVSLALSAIRWITGRRLKTLEDFDPAPENPF